MRKESVRRGKGRLHGPLWGRISLSAMTKTTKKRVWPTGCNAILIRETGGLLSLGSANSDFGCPRCALVPLFSCHRSVPSPVCCRGTLSVEETTDKPVFVPALLDEAVQFVLAVQLVMQCAICITH